MPRHFMLLACLLVLAAPRGVAAQDTAGLTVGEMVFTTDIEDREPVGAAETFTSRPDMIFCHTRIVGGTPPTHVFHVWRYGGEEKRRVRLDVGSSSWRTWSGRTTEALLAEGEGIWEVEVRGPDDAVLSRATFTVQPADR